MQPVEPTATREETMLRRKSLRLLTLAVGASLVGCAPVVFAPASGFGISLNRSLDLSISSCSLLGLSSHASRAGITSPTAQLGATRNQVAEIQNRYHAGSNWARKDMSSWRKVATGDC